MFSTCLHCHAALGANDELTPMPVGRTVAFDQARGRLWVICRDCARWNLVPVEERWEAIGSAERLWRETPTRFSSGEIGLAVRPSGLRLVRVGQPGGEEFAFWRFGETLRRRRRTTLVRAAVPVALLGAYFAGGLSALGAGTGLGVALHGYNWWHLLRSRGRMADTSRPGVLVPIREYDVREWRVGPGPDGQLRVERPPTALHLREALRQGSIFDGEHAHRALAMLMPVANRTGATQSEVQAAVRAVLDAGSPERFLERQAGARGTVRLESLGDIGRLALELANADARERRFMEGELLRLEWEWREAERIAAIADDLLLPAGVRALFDRLRGRTAADRTGAAGLPARPIDTDAAIADEAQGPRRDLHPPT